MGAMRVQQDMYLTAPFPQARRRNVAQWVGHHSESATGYPIPLPGPALPGPAINVSSRGRRSHQMQKARLLSPHILLPTPNDCAVAHMQFLWKKGSRRCTVALSHGTAGEMTSRAAAAIVVYRVAPGRCHSAILAAHAAICKTVAGVQSQPRACPINHVGDDILQMDVPCRLLPGSCHPGSAAHYDDG